MPVAPAKTPLADRPAAQRTALLVVDMISDWTYPGADRLAPQARRIAGAIARLKSRCVAAGVPTIYVNDNRGRWRSDFASLAAAAAEASEFGKAIARRLGPAANDYSVLKPKHSGFLATPLDLLLRHLKVERLLLTGVSTEHCLVATAIDAHMRDYEVLVPRDCAASQESGRNRRALAYLRESMRIATTVSARISIAGPRRRHGRSKIE